MLDNLRFWTIFLCIAGVIISVGWKQPLKYRFMSTEEIYALEHPAPPVVETKPKENWMLDPNRKTMLDRNPYNPKGYVGGQRQLGQQGTISR